MALFWGRLLNWLLQDCAGSWNKIRSLKQFHGLSYSTTQHRVSVWASSKWTISTFYSCFCVKTETPCSLVVSASKKSDSSKGQVQNARRFFYTPVIACHYINLFLSSQKKFCKKGIIVVIGNATQHEGEVRNKRDQLCRKVCIFLDVRSQSFFDANHRRAIWGEGET